MIKVGDTVTWKSQAQGTWKVKTGTVVEVVPIGARRQTKVIGAGLAPRYDVSYVVRVGSRLYWPRKVEQTDASPPPCPHVNCPVCASANGGT